MPQSQSVLGSCSSPRGGVPQKSRLSVALTNQTWPDLASLKDEQPEKWSPWAHERNFVAQNKGGTILYRHDGAGEGGAVSKIVWLICVFF